MKYINLLLAILGALSNAQGAYAQAAGSTAREPTCQTAAGLSYCRYPGASPLLILITGLGNTMQSWQPSLLQALNQHAGVIVYDRRGYGRSAGLAGTPVTAEA